MSIIGTKESLKMAKFKAKIRTILFVKFSAGNPYEAKEIAAKKLWDIFDEIDTFHDDIELDEIEEVIEIDGVEDV
jgi:hypothetical protein